MKPRLRYSPGCGWAPVTGCAIPSQEPPPPSAQLLTQVRTGFILQGTTLTQWCRGNDIRISNARNALIGTWNGPKGKAMRARLVKAAGIKEAA